MEDDKEIKKEIVPSSGTSLTRVSSGLIKRGLDLAKDVELGSKEEILGLFGKAGVLYKEENYEEAEHILRKLISYRPSGELESFNILALNSLAHCLNHLGKYEEAEITFREIIDLGYDDFQMRYHLGHAILLQGRISEAEQEFRIALRMNPNSHQAHGGLGAVLFAQKKYEEAEKASRRAVQLEPDVPGAHANLADVLSEMGRHKEAIKEMREAIRLKPKDAEVRVNYAAMLFYRGDFKGAVKVLKEAIIIDPNCTSALFVLAGSLDKKEKRREARQYWERLSKLKVQPDWVGLIKHRLSEPD